MMQSRAPIYVQMMDLTHYLMDRCQQFPRTSRPVLGERIQQLSLDVLEAVSEALRFPVGREQALNRADRGLLALRLMVRVAGERGLLKQRQVDFVAERLDELGRMIGGWLKQQRRVSEPPSPPRTLLEELLE